jgi:hypothetical protein
LILRKLLLAAIPVLFFSAAQAQENYIGIFAGASNYDGELQPVRYTFKEAHPAFGITFESYLTPHIAIRAGLSFAGISGDDRYAKDSSVILRNLSFRSNIVEFQVVGEYQLWDIQQKRWTPYGFVGLALFHFNPTALDTSGKRVALQPLSTEGQGLSEYSGQKTYTRTQLTIPFGGGVKFAVTPNFILGLEIGLRPTFTGYLDDVHGTYVDESTLLKEKGPLAVRMAYRTNRLPGHEDDPYPAAGTPRGSRHTDWYYYTGLTLAFRLGHGGIGGHTPADMKCPTY